MPDPTKPLPPASDPWEGRAAVPGYDPAFTQSTGPQVIFVEVARKRRWPWVLGIMGVLMVLCCGICGAVVAPVFGEWPSTIAATPAEVGGLKRDDNALVKLITAEANYRLRASEFIDGSFVNVFQDPSSKDKGVVAFGGTGLIWDPEKTLKDVIQGAGENIWDVSTFPPGSLGGLLKCGKGKDDQGKPVVMCAWIDHGSMGIGIFYGGRSKEDSATFMRALRSEIIVRP
ncbi:hypothetical protein [Catelliglobosispora koreensis]|uniref:hypothetical protein n=1 Tax=Catelliglobosispora koreensis TaxID=129052 RepID=UPI00035F0363|nr:hypothetical protein [Catelliglobosispora koreensis]